MAPQRQLTISHDQARPDDQAASQHLARRVVDVPVAREMSDSFLAYGLSVITSRAIPDVRDGLKPVQRRILWSMLQMGVRPGSPFRKSARIVGDTMGRYHPHGDAAIYDTLVRLGQDFGRMIPLVEPQGNFGSLDDPPAAARYTECRLAAAAMEMVSELDEATVDFRPTYDGEGTEPVVLPAALPNLLVNGTTGIAVGMATNMAPHNLAEVGAAVELVMRSQERKGGRATTDDLLGVVGGPDFPGGGRVVDQGLRQVFESGRGTVRVQARATTEKVTRHRRALVITELPYLVGPERVVDKVTALADSGRLDGVAGIADLTGMDGLRLQIDLKPGADPHAVLADLYRLTPLEESFQVNNVVLVNGVPTTVGFVELCEHYITHRLEVITRRTRHRLEAALRRLEIVEGLLIALDNIDEVVELIRSSQSVADARGALMARFGLTEVQATHILDMPLRRLAALERQKLRDEAAELQAAIADYREILGDEGRRRRMVRDELRRIVKQHGTARRSEIISVDEADYSPSDTATGDAGAGAGGREANGSGSARSAVANDTPCVLTVSTSGNLGRAPTDSGRKASAGRHDLIAARAVTTLGSPVALVTSAGRAFTVSASEAAEAGGRLRGAAVGPMLGLDKGEQVLAVVAPPPAGQADGFTAVDPVDPDAPAGRGDQRLVLVSRSGYVKRLTTEAVLACDYGDKVIALRPEDQLRAAFLAPDDAELVLVADDAKALITAASGFVVPGGTSAGALGMRLSPGAAVVGAAPAVAGGVLVLGTDAGGLKATSLQELPSQGRASGGVFAAKLSGGAKVTAMAVVANPAGLAGPDPVLFALKGQDANPRKLDPRPVPVRVEPSGRYTTPTPSRRPVFVLAPPRW